jgi:hypothetical protein
MLPQSYGIHFQTIIEIVLISMNLKIWFLFGMVNLSKRNKILKLIEIRTIQTQVAHTCSYISSMHN